jgi:uncharacterized protein YndB with AHSA1/START domain
MASTVETTSVVRELVIDAAPETVWEHLVDPVKAARWMGIAVEITPVAGSPYRCNVIPGHTAAGEVVEVDPPRRLVITWGWEPGEDGAHPVPPGTSTVEFELTPEASGTRLRFAHRDLPNADAAQQHTVGWEHYLSRLVVVAAGGDAGADPWVTGAEEDAVGA